jgi:hypothetical protein
MSNVQAYKAVSTTRKGETEEWIPIALGREQTILFREGRFKSVTKVVMVQKSNKQILTNFKSNISVNLNCRPKMGCTTLELVMTPPAELPYGTYGLQLLQANNQILVEFIFEVLSNKKPEQKNTIRKPAYNTQGIKERSLPEAQKIEQKPIEGRPKEQTKPKESERLLHQNYPVTPTW